MAGILEILQTHNQWPSPYNSSSTYNSRVFFPKICTGKSSKLLVPHFGQKCVAFVCSPKLPITCLKVAVWYSGVLRAPYLSNEFSKLVSIVDTLGSFVSKSAPPENQTSAHKFPIYQFSSQHSAKPPHKPNPTAPSSAPESEAMESRASTETAEALRSRSEPPEAPAITVSERPAMRRNSERRRGGTRKDWARAADAELLGFGNGVDWRRKRRPGALGTATAICEEGGKCEGCGWKPRPERRDAVRSDAWGIREVPATRREEWGAVNGD